MKSTLHSRLDTVRRQLADEYVWMQQHGTTLEGYLRTYGSRADRVYFGAGGEAIYAADLAAVQRLEFKLGRLEAALAHRTSSSLRAVGLHQLP